MLGGERTETDTKTQGVGLLLLLFLRVCFHTTVVTQNVLVMVSWESQSVHVLWLDANH